MSTANETPSMDEPQLEDMLRDPIMLRLMRSDGIDVNQLRAIIAQARVVQS